MPATKCLQQIACIVHMDDCIKNMNHAALVSEEEIEQEMRMKAFRDVWLLLYGTHLVYCHL